MLTTQMETTEEKEINKMALVSKIILVLQGILTHTNK